MGRVRIAILLVVVLLTSISITGCVDLFTRPGGTYLNQGNKLYEQGRLDEAIGKYTESIGIAPGWEEPWYRRGVAYCDLGQTERGIEDFNEAIRLCLREGEEPWDKPYYSRGLAYMELGMETEAIADFETCISLTDDPELIEEANQQIEELSR
ncbi:MAG: tetratricopeptide repeat protein [Dehalococcoidales bacterium]|nr:MAG: tetratricopeptide repeat protein [Dehalococcoidales bacterium]